MEGLGGGKVWIEGEKDGNTFSVLESRHQIDEADDFFLFF